MHLFIYDYSTACRLVGYSCIVFNISFNQQIQYEQQHGIEKELTMVLGTGFGRASGRAFIHCMCIVKLLVMV